MLKLSRREFIRSSAALAGLGLMPKGNVVGKHSGGVQVCGHLWVYASRYPPDWDCTPILEQVFSDFKYAGIEGVEMMDTNLRHPDSWSRVKEMIDKYKVPVSGTSYGGNMWNKAEHSRILEDDITSFWSASMKLAARRWALLSAMPKRKRQGRVGCTSRAAQKIMKVCESIKFSPIFIIIRLKLKTRCTISKELWKEYPEIKLGPDLNWLCVAAWILCGLLKLMGDRWYTCTFVIRIQRQMDGSRWGRGDGFPCHRQGIEEINYSGRAAIELAFDGRP